MQGYKVYEDDVNSNLQTRNLSSNLIQSINKNDDSLKSSSSSSNLSNAFQSEEIAQSEREENVRQLIIDCKKELVDDEEDCYGSWGLINYSEYLIFLKCITKLELG